MRKLKKYSIVFYLRELGNYLSSLIMPNLSVFIAWGLINFLANFVSGKMYLLLNGTEDILINFLLPLLIGYTGGKKIDHNRGGAIAGIATLGIMVGNDNSAVLGAMIIGPIAVMCFKRLNILILKKIQNGYEMLLQNILAGVVGTLFCLVGLFILTPIINFSTLLAISGVHFLITHHLLPLVNVIIEPLKVFFFNNAINHGVLTPLGLNMVKETGQSILFLLEVNPGPGLGILLAFSLYGNQEERKQGAGASMIHLFGGIHEVYFPFVLKEPKLFLVAILSGITGTTIFQFLNAGLTMPVSPGSIILMLTSAPSHSRISLLLGVLGSALVSFILSLIILLNRNDEKNVAVEIKGESQMIDQIIVACDAGIGSSAMGASLIDKELKRLGIELPVTNQSIYEVENSRTSLVLVHSQLKNQLQELAPKVQILEIDNFLDIQNNASIILDYLEDKEIDNELTTKKTISNNIEIVLLFENNVRGSQTMACELMRIKAHQLEINLVTKKEAIENVVYSPNRFYIVSEEFEQKYCITKQINTVFVMTDLFNMTEFESWLKGVKN
ncbi:PTS mannitol transporter subunit IICB [Vagococcus fluvialis]|uniref:PTS mannitol transporter subunit IICB n=1 Tax=Vagococcus fluvialis TaxID=2738 RepID=UPI001432CC98|nr:PTS mannitol transporter subunit IICB [Vagococcus fluvialis]MBO0487423.1 PTS mannitol transporter subunit IICB [Vagococcus fluvialis]NKC58519.1 PTS mannitol transporter subunit IICB [Vagococcus fluvialis]NKD49249.1 PTS mannitol transporter subunit IICB [Vagococcus fluvialis]